MGDLFTVAIFSLVILFALFFLARNTLKFIKEGKDEPVATPGQAVRATANTKASSAPKVSAASAGRADSKVSTISNASTSTKSSAQPRVVPGRGHLVISLDKSKTTADITPAAPKVEVPKAESPKAEAPKAEAPKVQATQPEPVKAGPATPEPAKPEPVKDAPADPVAVEAPKSAEGKPEPVKAEEPKPEPAATAEVKQEEHTVASEAKAEEAQEVQVESKWPPVKVQGPKGEGSKVIERIDNILAKHFNA